MEWALLYVTGVLTCVALQRQMPSEEATKAGCSRELRTPGTGGHHQKLIVGPPLAVPAV